MTKDQNWKFLKLKQKPERILKDCHSAQNQFNSKYQHSKSKECKMFKFSKDFRGAQFHLKIFACSKYLKCSHFQSTSVERNAGWKYQYSKRLLACACSKNQKSSNVPRTSVGRNASSRQQRAIRPSWVSTEDTTVPALEGGFTWIQKSRVMVSMISFVFKWINKWIASHGA